jgi:hypothetical protein
VCALLPDDLHFSLDHLCLLCRSSRASLPLGPALSLSRTVTRHVHAVSESDPYLPSLDALIMDFGQDAELVAAAPVAPAPLASFAAMSEGISLDLFDNLAEI